MKIICNSAWMLALATLPLAGSLQEVRADLVEISYYDRGIANPATNGGPLWTGVVDTITNRLRIDTWSELPGHGAEFWVPQNLPLVWPARDASGNIYDVPNDFGSTIGGTVSIDDNFAFISPDAANDMSWEDIDGTAQTFGTIHPPTRVGWGGFAEIVTAGGPFIFHTSAIGGEEDYDERTLPRLPVTPNNMFASLGATVEVTDRTATTAAVVTSIPEASSVLGGLLIASWCAAAKLWRRQRTLLAK